MITVAQRDIGKLKAIWKRLADRIYREAFVEARLRESIAAQIYFIRESRKLTQGQLADILGTKQPAVSRIERGEASLSLKTLEGYARAFDVALSVKFVPYSDVAEELISERIEAYIPPFEDDTPAKLVPVHSSNLPRIRSYELNQTVPMVQLGTIASPQFPKEVCLSG
jgi:transcriptional regulator with XRE-family HTH domain